MGYEVIVSSKAEKEIEEVIDYYFEFSNKVPLAFIEKLEEAYAILSVNPYFRIRKNKLRAIPIKDFPFLLFFAINEENKTVRILACFHTAKNPKKYPK